MVPSDAVFILQQAFIYTEDAVSHPTMSAFFPCFQVCWERFVRFRDVHTLSSGKIAKHPLTRRLQQKVGLILLTRIELICDRKSQSSTNRIRIHSVQKMYNLDFINY